MQVLIPLVCCIAFATTSPDPFGMAVMGWWTGENLMDVAIYIDDARALNLVLLGGHTGAEVEGHDWEHILQLTGLIAHDHQIAWTVHWIGAGGLTVARRRAMGIGVTSLDMVLYDESGMEGGIRCGS